MAIKPTESYVFADVGETAQVPNAETTGWASDAVPPKREQFNGRLNILGRWWAWAEPLIDAMKTNVLDRFFVSIDAGEVNNTDQVIAAIPNANGIYRAFGSSSIGDQFEVLAFVSSGHMFAYGVHNASYNARMATHNGTSWVIRTHFRRSVSALDITNRNDTAYVTPDLLYQTGGQVTTGTNAYGGGWSEVTAGPNWIVLTEWGTVTIPSTGAAFVPTRSRSVYGVNTGATATAESASANASCSRADASGIRITTNQLVSGDPSQGTVYWNYTILIPRP